MEKVGLVVVHGIGDQDAGATAKRFVDALVAGDDRLTQTRCDEKTFQIEGAGRVIRVYEAHWADVLKHQRGAFDVARFQAMALFPRRNRKHGMYPETVRRGEIWAWTVVMYLAGAVAAVASFGLSLAGRLVDSIANGRGRAPREEQRERQRESPRPPLLTRIGTGIKRSWNAQREEQRNRYPVVEKMLDDRAGDIFRYVDAASEATEEGSDADEILEQFHAALRRPFEDGCGEIQILAHSLGSVVAYHGLAGYRVARDESIDLRRISRIWTIGSPLQKISFIWPALTGLAPPPGLAAPWTNFKNRSDPVSGLLRAFPEWNVTNVVVGGGGLLSSHVGYSKNDRFTTELRDALVPPDESRTAPAPPDEPRTTPAPRAAGRMQPSVELAAVIVGVIVLLAAGLFLFAWTGAIFAGFVWLVGRAVGLVFGGLGRAITDAIYWVGAGVAAFMFVMLVVVVPWTQARTDHARWLPGAGEPAG